MARLKDEEGELLGVDRLRDPERATSSGKGWDQGGVWGTLARQLRQEGVKPGDFTDVVISGSVRAVPTEEGHGLQWPSLFSWSQGPVSASCTHML